MKNDSNLMSHELQPGIYDPRSGNTSRKCQNPNCDVVFQGHANRRYCGEQCKRKMEISKRAARDAIKYYVHPSALVYSKNVSILERIMAELADHYKCVISTKKLFALGFDENSPSDPVINPNFDFQYDQIWKFGQYFLCFQNGTQYYTVVKAVRKPLISRRIQS